jgi:hypothetical protein
VNTIRNELPPRPASVHIQSCTPVVNTPRELPPRPAAYRSSRVTEQPPIMDTSNQVRLIYTKSGFYQKSTNPMEDNNIHGFLSIFSKSMVSDSDQLHSSQ